MTPASLPSLIAVAGFVTVALSGRSVARQTFVAIVLGAIAFDAAIELAAARGGRPDLGPWLQALFAWSLVAGVWSWGAADRRRWWTAAKEKALVLDAPFPGRWRVAAGGPWPGENHHLVASDQRYAYDFLRADAPSFGSPIFAPADGVVAAVRDGMRDREPRRRLHEERRRPFGNYVAIDTGSGFVMLCHLRCGSVRVAAGDAVRAGEEVGRCGNSGNTTVSHLHLHAQDRAGEAPFVAQGVPVAFRDGERVRVLNVRDYLPGGGRETMARGAR